MNGEKISRCLDALPDEMLEEAMKPYKPHSFWGRIARIAACLAIIVGLLVGIPQIPTDSTNIVTGTGILSVTVYAINAETEEIISEQLEAGIDVDNSHYWPLVMNRYPGLPVFLSVETDAFPSDKITYDISVDYGEYIDWRNTDVQINYVGKNFSMPNNVGIYWQGLSGLTENGSAMDIVYTKILIRCENHIVGYALLRFDQAYGRDVIKANPGLADYWAGKEDQPAAAYWSNLIVSVSFPKVDGEYQHVSEEYVQKCMQEVINSQ